ncbi:MAG: biotin--[acetyl-CoA-carboxylase] ligase [Sphingobacteriales bacterium]|nr:biotin--[acetyl-CoA-carboxylase] ligase [Sphingobacteriales bacterium]
MPWHRYMRGWQNMESAAVALGVYDFFSKYAGDETTIKWPNDIYWRDRKAGGILIENIIAGAEYRWAIAGIGININQTNFPESLPNPVSLKQITGKDRVSFQLAEELHRAVLNRTDQLKAEGFQPIYQSYQSHLYKMNQLQKFKKQNRVFEAIVKDVSPCGQLVVQHATEESYDFGEIEWVIIKN